MQRWYLPIQRPKPKRSSCVKICDGNLLVLIRLYSLSCSGLQPNALTYEIILSKVEFQSDRGISCDRAIQMLQRARKRHADAKRHERSSCDRAFGEDDGFYSWRPRAAGGRSEYVLMLEKRRDFSPGLSHEPVFAVFTPHVRELFCCTFRDFVSLLFSCLSLLFIY